MLGERGLYGSFHLIEVNEMLRMGVNFALPTLKNQDEVLKAIKNGFGWFVTYDEMWDGPTVAEAPARWRRAMPRDPRATRAFMIFSVEPNKVLITVSYLVGTGRRGDITEFRAETPDFMIDEDLMAEIYGWVEPRGDDR